MTSKAKYLLLGAPLLALAKFSAADPRNEQSSAGLTDSVIVTGAHSTDRDIRAEVLRRIGEAPALGTENIDVQSLNHNVYLYGSVTSRMDSEAAEAIVRTVPGVKNVYNALGVLGA